MKPWARWWPLGCEPFGGLSASAGHHEWACFASHQAAEKALKALHLSHGQQAWGHGLGRSLQDLPESVRDSLDQAVPDLLDRLRVLDAFYVPTRYPDSFPEGAPLIILVASRVRTLFAMPVRSLTQSVLRWPEPEQVLTAVCQWAEQQGKRCSSL